MGNPHGLAPLTFVCKTISRNETYLSVLVEDEAGVLTRIAGLFARRGF